MPEVARWAICHPEFVPDIDPFIAVAIGDCNIPPSFSGACKATNIVTSDIESPFSFCFKQLWIRGCSAYAGLLKGILSNGNQKWP